jgi:hypothetical protein
LTKCSATSGGKDRRASGSGPVAKASETVEPKAFGPRAHVPHAQAAPFGGVLQRLPLIEQEEDAAPARQSRGAGGRALPVLDFRSVCWSQDDGQGRFAATHGDTEDSR